MALPHATSGQLIDIRPLGTRISSSVSNALFKTPQLELMRLVPVSYTHLRAHET